MHLNKNSDLVRIAGTWFVRDLMLDVDIGHLHLAEAALDMNSGGPMTPGEILQQIGGLGDSPEPLQIFSLNFAINRDERFDEVGPAGQILWHFKRTCFQKWFGKCPRFYNIQRCPSIAAYSAMRCCSWNTILTTSFPLSHLHRPLTRSV